MQYINRLSDYAADDTVLIPFFFDYDQAVSVRFLKLPEQMDIPLFLRTFLQNVRLPLNSAESMQKNLSGTLYAADFMPDM